MKISNLNNTLKQTLGIVALAGIPLFCTTEPVQAQKLEKMPDKDKFETSITVPPEGTSNKTVLLFFISS